MREFDIINNEFVMDSPFQAREAKNKVSWHNDHSLWIGSDFGDLSLTESGYPRLSKLWQRGEPLETAKIVFAGEPQDVSAMCFTTRDTHTEETYSFSLRTKTFYEKNTFFITNLKDYTTLVLRIPDTADFNGLFDRQLILKLNYDWTVSDHIYPAGSVVSVDFLALIHEDNLQVSSIFCPDSENKSVYASLTLTKNHLVLTTLKDVCCELWRYHRADNVWYSAKVNFHEHGVIAVTAARKHTDECFVTFHNLTTPATLYHYDVSTEVFTRMKQTPKKFEHENFITEQYFATHIENDQEIRVPYFVARHKDMVFDGSNPTWLYGYGGFKLTLYPSYIGGIKGKFWLEQGGVYVIAGIRGGGEYGPKWHQAAKRENRPKAFRDFIAVAEDLITRGISSPKYLGISGGSNGALLVNAVINMRPDLFNAVHSSLGILDMLAYHKLLAGASWKAEYGNPELPDDAKYLTTFSPPHNYCADNEYPQILFTTSQTDDRVHPYHSRISVKRLQDLGKTPLYFEIIDGGHGSGISNKQQAFSCALEYVYFLRKLHPAYNMTLRDTASLTTKPSTLSLFRPMEEAHLEADNIQQVTQNTSTIG